MALSLQSTPFNQERFLFGWTSKLLSKIAGLQSQGGNPAAGQAVQGEPSQS